MQSKHTVPKELICGIISYGIRFGTRRQAGMSLAAAEYRYHHLNHHLLRSSHQDRRSCSAPSDSCCSRSSSRFCSAACSEQNSPGSLPFTKYSSLACSPHSGVAIVPLVGSTYREMTPCGTGNSLGGTCCRDSSMNCAKIGAPGMLPPRRSFDPDHSRSRPPLKLRREADHPGIRFVVPVLPAAGRFKTCATLAAVPPGSNTLSINLVST